MTHQVGLHSAAHRFGGFASPSHFPQADDSVIRLRLHDRSDKSSPVAASGMAERRLQRHGHSGGPYVPYFHRKLVSSYNNMGAFLAVLHVWKANCREIRLDIPAQLDIFSLTI